MIVETIFYLLLNAVRIYIMYRFIGLFLERRKQKRGIFLSFVVFYIINSAGYLGFNNDILNLTINFGGFLLIILFGYKGSIKKKILMVVADICVALITEDMAWIIFDKGKNEQMEQFGFFFSVFILFLMEIIFEKTIQIRRGIEISLSKNLLLILISVGSMFISNTMIEGLYHNILTLIASLGILLAVNIMVFYLYEKILNDYVRQREKEMYKIQLEAYQNQLKIMMGANDTYKSLRHDMKHHMIMVSDYIKRSEKEKALAYLNKINCFISSGDQFINTGNEGIDCIFNYIIEEINKEGGTIKTNIKVAEGMMIDDFDINIILSNLLFNAFEAIQQCDEKEIHAYMRYDRGVLRLKVENTYNGVLKQRNGELLSTKRNDKEHGIGLANVRKAVEKYGGDMKIEYTDKKFIANVFLYI